VPIAFVIAAVILIKRSQPVREAFSSSFSAAPSGADGPSARDLCPVRTSRFQSELGFIQCLEVLSESHWTHVQVLNTTYRHGEAVVRQNELEQ
jgi:hypothetical protein